MVESSCCYNIMVAFASFNGPITLASHESLVESCAMKHVIEMILLCLPTLYCLPYKGNEVYI